MAPAKRDVVEVRAKTVDEAVQRALSQLKLSRSQVEVTVLEEGRAGIFGIGATSALVRVAARGAGGRSAVAEPSSRPLPRIDDYADYEEAPSRDAAPVRSRRRGGRRRDRRREDGDGGNRRSPRQPEERERPRSRERGRAPRQEFPLPPIQREAFDLLADPDFEPDEDPTTHATNVVIDLLHLIGVRAEVSARTPETPMDGLNHATAVIDIQPIEPEDDLTMLIGPNGENLAALQYVVNVVISRSLDGEHPITLDVAGYKRQREQELNEIARRGAEEARQTREPVELEPMPAAERRIVHLALSEEDDLETESEGQGDARRVVIVYRGDE